MLQYLSIKNFAIVEQLEIEFQNKMTVITGETGAGKSITMDALSLCLGERATNQSIKEGCEKAEIYAEFSIEKNETAKQYLDEIAIDYEQTCSIKRIIANNSPSKIFINGSNCQLTQLKTLGTYLIRIHGQNENQKLKQSEHQRIILDQYGQHQTELTNCNTIFQEYQTIHKEYLEKEQQHKTQQTQQELLEYQYQELEEFNLQKDEYQDLERQHKKQASLQELIDNTNQIKQELFEAEINASRLLQNSIRKLKDIEKIDQQLNIPLSMLEEALIQIEESKAEINKYHLNLEEEPEKFQNIEQRLSQALNIARKHQIKPDEIYQFHQNIKQKINQTSNIKLEIQKLQELQKHKIIEYKIISDKIHEKRIITANKISNQVNENIQKLNMKEAIFKVEVTKNNHMTSHGEDNIIFQIATNKGQSLKPLTKFISGGELSRINLALEIITAQKIATPTLIFDEVDTGISGYTADQVGEMLRNLGEHTQVLAITHIPQVAGAAHQHILIEKKTRSTDVINTSKTLNFQEQINEIARLITGSSITPAAQKNAAELVKNIGPET